MLDPRIERMLQETEQESSLSPGAAKDLREAVESSPYLVEVMTKAIDNGDLEHIKFARTPNEGGHYNHGEKTISVNADVLQRPSRSERIDQLTGVLGHEAGHALMARSNELSTYKLSYRIDEALKEGARYGDATVDITPLAKEYINASRQNEALAEMVSMNSVPVGSSTKTATSAKQNCFIASTRPRLASRTGGWLQASRWMSRASSTPTTASTARP